MVTITSGINQETPFCFESGLFRKSRGDYTTFSFKRDSMEVNKIHADVLCSLPAKFRQS